MAVIAHAGSTEVAVAAIAGTVLIVRMLIRAIRRSAVEAAHATAVAVRHQEHAALAAARAPRRTGRRLAILSMAAIAGGGLFELSRHHAASPGSPVPAPAPPSPVVMPPAGGGPARNDPHGAFHLALSSTEITLIVLVAIFIGGWLAWSFIRSRQ